MGWYGSRGGLRATAPVKQGGSVPQSDQTSQEHGSCEAASTRSMTAVDPSEGEPCFTDLRRGAPSPSDETKRED